MSDVLTSEQRSYCMSRIKSADTKPEMIVRSLVHRMGYRFRVHRKELPGNPDLVFTSKKKIIFVHGCFWHQHRHCRYATIPKTRREFWAQKLANNRLRDRRVKRELTLAGWNVLLVWECETKDKDTLADRLSIFLG